MTFMQRYYLSPHVYVCRTKDHAILLDLRADKYLAIGEPEITQLSLAIEGWPTSPLAATAADQNSEDPQRLLSQMLERDLITTEAALRPRESAPSLLDPASSLVGEYADPPERYGARRVVRLVIDVAQASLLLRTRGLEAAVALVQRRRKQTADAEARFSIDQAQEEVAVFEALRPLFFKARDKCLLDSLALLNFLAHKRLFPRWVIGVSTGPFRAHSWVQQGSVVLNDLPERVDKFTPILVV